MSVPEIVDVRPTGARFLVELLTTQESSGSELFVSDTAKAVVHQAYVLDVGPQVPADYGVKAGDRVWIDGAITFAPRYGSEDSGRKKGTIDFHMIKGIIVESKKKK